MRGSAALIGAGLVTTLGLPLVVGASSAAAASPGSNLGGLSATDGYTTTAALSPGSIQHVWLIILENKSYNSEFTGLNNNTYLWQTLPAEGVLLKNYYGTGHTSQDNYISLVSGQGPQYDDQSDCSLVNSEFASNTAVTASYDATGVYNGGLNGIVNAGTGGTAPAGDTQNWAFGQAVSAKGPNFPIGTNKTNTNGCTYPSQVATLFDQFNQAGVTWKGYAQDLGGSQQDGATSFQASTVPGRDSGTCGAPGNPDQSPENPATNPTYLSGGGGVPIAGQLVNSTATGGSTTGLSDSSQTWTANQYLHDEVIITGGTGADEFATITANTANTLTVASWSALPGTTSVPPASGSTYVIGVPDSNNYTAASLLAGGGTGPDGQSYSLSPYNPEFSDQYVAKHFPFGWFESLTGVGSGTALNAPTNGGTNCDNNHIANLDNPTNGLVHDLQNNTVPNFSWITPDNCSDGHDSACKGNNLSGAFGTNADGTDNLNDPIYTPSTTPGANCTPNCTNIPSYDPEATTPRNFTGGTYSADLFLAYYVPLIEKSAAFQHGLIDVTFDEGEPSFIYGGNTFNNIPTTGPNSASAPDSGLNLPSSGTGTAGPAGLTLAPGDTLSYGSAGTSAPGADSPEGADDLFAGSAAESFFTTATTPPTAANSEPTGPNSPLVTDASGNQKYYGPGFDLDIHRPPACTSGTVDGTSTNCVVGAVIPSGDLTSAAQSTRSDTVGSSVSSVNDGSLNATDTGREIVSVTNSGNVFAPGSTG